MNDNIDRESSKEQIFKEKYELERKILGEDFQGFTKKEAELWNKLDESLTEEEKDIYDKLYYFNKLK